MTVPKAERCSQTTNFRLFAAWNEGRRRQCAQNRQHRSACSL